MLPSGILPFQFDALPVNRPPNTPWLQRPGNGSLYRWHLRSTRGCKYPFCRYPVVLTRPIIIQLLQSGMSMYGPIREVQSYSLFIINFHRVRLQEPIKEAGILEGRNGIKETMLQHAARYLADQDWVKTDSMKTIENTAVPIIQLVAQMPLQPLQASSSPSEKTPEERSGNGSPSEARGLASEDPPGDVSLIGVPGERSIPAELPGGAAELAEGGVGASGGAVGETAGVAGVDSLGCPVLWEAAHSTAEEANGVAGLREVLHDGGEPAPSGGKSMEGASDRHENGVLERGAPERRTGGVSSLGAESTMKSNSCPLTSVGAEPPGSGPPPPGEAAAATPAGEPSADVSTTSLADVSTEMGTSDRGSADVRDEPAEHGLDGRRHSAPGEVVPDEPVKGGHVAPPEAAKIGWRGHVAMVRTRPGGGDVAGPDSPGDQERRLVKLDISFEGVQHTGSRTTDLVSPR